MGCNGSTFEELPSLTKIAQVGAGCNEQQWEEFRGITALTKIAHLGVGCNGLQR